MFLVLATMFAHATARMRFRGQHGLRLLTMVGLFIPLQVIMIPIAVLVRDPYQQPPLGGHRPLCGLNLPFTMLVLYGAMREPALELEESACLDGASYSPAFLKIVCPM